ncbi:ammonium transporter Amt1 [Savitreella phatthalungensis]
MSSLPDITEFTGSNGGDSMQYNLNALYDKADFAWILTSTALVWLMVPGVGFFYSGLARRKSALSLIWLSLMSLAVVSFQWFFWGYSLTFAHDGSAFMGNLSMFAMRNTLALPSSGASGLPDLLYAVYQLMFAAITPALAIGAAAERGRLLPCIVFIFCWTTLVYDPIACWTWNSNGWIFTLGGLDFAGGTPVHISSGMAALAYSVMLGKRRGHGTRELNYRPHNVTHVVLGTVFLWFGWFGFNGGSALGANLRAVMACVVTNLAAATGGLTWMLWDYRLERKWSVVGFCSGAVSGLVAITPASGFVQPWAAFVIGVCGGTACNWATKLKYWIRVDDALDIFASHAVGGIVGGILTGLFASSSVAALDGASQIPGGWIDHHYIQLGYQLAGICAGAAWSFTVSCILLAIMNFIPGLSLRVTEDEEIRGIDEVEHGEFAFDWVEKERDFYPDSTVIAGKPVVQDTTHSVSESASEKRVADMA